MRDDEKPARGKWTVDVRAIMQLAVAIAILAAIAAFLRHGKENRETWETVRGTFQNTRIVPDHARETAWGSEPTWRAEYNVSYLVADHEYAVWTDSGVRGESETAVRLALPKSNLTCVVKYNSEKPEPALADCR